MTKTTPSRARDPIKKKLVTSLIHQGFFVHEKLLRNAGLGTESTICPRCATTTKTWGLVSHIRVTATAANERTRVLSALGTSQLRESGRPASREVVAFRCLVLACRSQEMSGLLRRGDEEPHVPPHG